MQVGKEFVRGIGHVALRKQRIAMCGFIRIFDYHIARPPSKFFELVDGLASPIQITGSGIGAGPLPPDGSEGHVAVGFGHSGNRPMQN